MIVRNDGRRARRDEVHHESVPITVIVPTLNEEMNIGRCLRGIYGWADEIVVLDAGSADRTSEIAKEYAARVIVHSFGRHAYAKQKNWAINDVSLRNEWVFILDADEAPTEGLKATLRERLPVDDLEIAGFLVNIRLIFLGREIIHGAHAPNWALRVFRRDRVRFEEITGLEYAVADGKTPRLEGMIMHYSSPNLAHWIAKQNEYSDVEALAMVGDGDTRKRRLAGGKTERRGLAKVMLWPRLPLLIRPLMFFIYGYFFRLGFLDGREGLIYSYLMFFWYRFLVDAKYIELKSRAARGPSTNSRNEAS